MAFGLLKSRYVKVYDLWSCEGQESSEEFFVVFNPFKGGATDAKPSILESV